MDKVHPCVKFRKSSALPLLCFSFDTCVHRPRYCTHLLPFQMLMGLNRAGALELEVDSLLWREFIDGHAEFLSFCSAGSKKFFVVGNSSWPQSQQLTAMHHGCPTIVTMYNETKSIIKCPFCSPTNHSLPRVCPVVAWIFHPGPQIVVQSIWNCMNWTFPLSIINLSHPMLQPECEKLSFTKSWLMGSMDINTQKPQSEKKIHEFSFNCLIYSCLCF